MYLSCDYQNNLHEIKKILPVDDSFDVIGRDIQIGGRAGYLLFIDGFAKDEVMYYFINHLQQINPGEGISIQEIIRSKTAYLEMEVFTELDILKKSVLSGALALVIEGETEGLIIDAREYPIRSPEEPEAEKVTRGAKDGFVETIVYNTALMRRRVRDPNLVFEIKTVGERSQTDVVIGYIRDLADPNLLARIRNQIDSIHIPALVMAERSLEELLVKKKWYNPLPQVKFTERPDVAASYLLEGHVVIAVDTSPSVMILPATVFYFTQDAEDYYQNPLVGTYVRWIRFIAIFVSLLLTPTWLLLAESPHLLPEALQFIGVKETGIFPLPIQFLLLEFGFDLLRLSSLHTPGYLGAAFGIVGGLLIGEVAIKVGFFVTEAIFYMAVSAVANYCIPNVEFGSAIRLFKLFILILTGLFGIWGYAAGILIVILITATTETFDKNRKYTWPLFPFDAKALKNIWFRRPVSRLDRKK